MGNKIEDIRELPKRIILFFGLILFLLAFGTISFKFLLNLSFGQAFIATLENMAFLFQPASGLARILGIFMALFGVILLWWILWSLFDIVSEGSLREYLKISDSLKKLKKMRNHYIVAGGGRVGEDLAVHFCSNKKECIIIEKDETTSARLKKNKKFFVMHGDVTDESVLKQAKIKDARAIILAMPETEKNLLVTMMARELNPTIDIYARADKPAFVSKLKKAGAKVVIVPEQVAAERFLESID